jgi:chromosome segregation ATPase
VISRPSKDYFGRQKYKDPTYFNSAQVLALRKKELESEMTRLKCDLSEAQEDLDKSDEARKALKLEIREVTTKVLAVEERLENEKRKQNR